MTCKIKGIIFDMDGVISDTQCIFSKIQSSLFEKLNISISPEQITRKYAGMNTREFFKQVLNDFNVQYDIDLLLEEMWNTMYENIEGNLKPIKGTIPFIKYYYAKNIPLAVASSSKIDFVKKVLKGLEIDNYFTAIVGGDMVKKGKPDPEIFLLAASKIQIPPNDCLVIEDGISGMTAAKDANMFCIGLVKDVNQTYPTKNLVKSLNEVGNYYLQNLKK